MDYDDFIYIPWKVSVGPDEYAEKVLVKNNFNNVRSEIYFYDVSDTEKLTVKEKEETIALIRQLNEFLSIPVLTYRVFILPFPHKKQIPEKPLSMLTRRSINTAFTNMKTMTIIVYRKEELVRVLIHEFLHHSSLIPPWNSKETHQIDTSITNTIKSMFPTAKFKCATTEAICEFYTSWFLYKQCKTKSSQETFIKKETDFCTYQCQKLLSHFENDFNNWKEETPAFSYFFLKLILLFNFKELNSNPNSLPQQILINFFKDPINFKNLLDSIRSFKRPKFLQNREDVYSLRMSWHRV